MPLRVSTLIAQFLYAGLQYWTIAACFAAPPTTQMARRLLVGGGFRPARRRSCRAVLRDLHQATPI